MQFEFDDAWASFAVVEDFLALDAAWRAMPIATIEPRFILHLTWAPLPIKMYRGSDAT
jgi:hypothetical protein